MTIHIADNSNKKTEGCASAPIKNDRSHLLDIAHFNCVPIQLGSQIPRELGYDNTDSRSLKLAEH